LDIEQNQRYSAKEIDYCIGLLTYMVNNGKAFVSLPKKKQIELIKIAGQLSRPDRHQLKQRNKAIRKIKRQQIVSTERKVRAATGIRLAREAEVFSAPLQLLDNTESTKGALVLESHRTNL